MAIHGLYCHHYVVLIRRNSKKKLDLYRHLVLIRCNSGKTHRTNSNTAAPSLALGAIAKEKSHMTNGNTHCNQNDQKKFDHLPGYNFENDDESKWTIDGKIGFYLFEPQMQIVCVQLQY